MLSSIINRQSISFIGASEANINNDLMKALTIYKSLSEPSEVFWASFCFKADGRESRYSILQLLEE